MVPPLSYTSQFGYYGLRVNPTLEQAIGSLWKPLGIPLPDRAAKWYATSIYRAHILDAAEKGNAHEQATLDYRASGAELPQAAAQVQASAAGDDETFKEVHRQGDAHEQQKAYELAYKTMLAERRRQDPCKTVHF